MRFVWLYMIAMIVIAYGMHDDGVRAFIAVLITGMLLGMVLSLQIFIRIGKLNIMFTAYKDGDDVTS